MGKSLIQLMRESFTQYTVEGFSETLGIEHDRAQVIFGKAMKRFKENFIGKCSDTKGDLIKFAVDTGNTPNEVYFLIWIMAEKLGENKAKIEIEELQKRLVRESLEKD